MTDYGTEKRIAMLTRDNRLLVDQIVTQVYQHQETRLTPDPPGWVLFSERYPEPSEDVVLLVSGRFGGIFFLRWSVQNARWQASLSRNQFRDIEELGHCWMFIPAPPPPAEEL